MRAYSYMSGARKDAKADAKRLAAEAAGIPVRTSDDPRQPIELDLSRVGGDRLLLEPRRGHLLKWRLRDQDTGEVLACGALKTMLHEAADRLPRAQVMD